MTMPGPTAARPFRLGSANVVEPSPTPQYVPMTAKSALYVVRDTVRPSQMSQPEGAWGPAKSASMPIGEAWNTSVSSVERFAFHLLPHVSRLAPTSHSVKFRCGVYVSGAVVPLLPASRCLLHGRWRDQRRFHAVISKGYIPRR